MPFWPCLTSFCGLPGPQRLRQVVPELEEARVEHLEDAADVARAVAVEVERADRRVGVARGRPVAVAIEELHRHEGIEEIGDAARVQPELAAELARRSGGDRRAW